MSVEVFLIIPPGKESLPEKLPHTSALSLSLLSYLLAGVPLGKLNEGINLKKANCAHTSYKNNSSERKKKKKNKFHQNKDCCKCEVIEGAEQGGPQDLAKGHLLRNHKRKKINLHQEKKDESPQAHDPKNNACKVSSSYLSVKDQC